MGKILKAIYRYDKLEDPEPKCLVCGADLADQQDRQPLSMRYPHADDPFIVFAYACRPCFESRRDEVQAYAESHFHNIIHDHLHIIGFVES